MATRPQIKPNLNSPLINAGDMSADITGPVTILADFPSLGYDIKWTGTPTGTIAVQVSNTAQFDGQGNYIAGTGNWTIIPSSAFTGTYPVPSGSASNGFIDLFGTSAYCARLVYTAGSGSGSLTVVLSGKAW